MAGEIRGKKGKTRKTRRSTAKLAGTRQKAPGHQERESPPLEIQPRG
jgi:hypothetical protein